jgi:hypothetical protein
MRMRKHEVSASTMCGVVSRLDNPDRVISEKERGWCGTVLKYSETGWLGRYSNNNFNLLVSYYKLKRAAASVLKKVPPR